MVQKIKRLSIKVNGNIIYILYNKKIKSIFIILESIMIEIR